MIYYVQQNKKGRKIKMEKIIKVKKEENYYTIEIIKKDGKKEKYKRIIKIQQAILHDPDDGDLQGFYIIKKLCVEGKNITDSFFYTYHSDQYVKNVNFALNSLDYSEIEYFLEEGYELEQGIDFSKRRIEII